MRLTAAERKLNKAMLEALEYAQAHPKMWHNIGPDEVGKAAIAALKARGAVEVNEVSNQFRLRGKE